MQLLKRYDSVINFELDKPGQEVIDIISTSFRKCWVVDSKITVEEKPTFFDPFSARGLIIFRLSPSNKMGTLVHAEVKPRSITQDSVYFLVFIFALLFLVSFPFTPILVSLSFTIGGFVVTAVLLHFKQKLNSGKLENTVFRIKQKIEKSTN